MTFRQNKSGITTLNLYRTLQFWPQTFGGALSWPRQWQATRKCTCANRLAVGEAHVMLESLCWWWVVVLTYPFFASVGLNLYIDVIWFIYLIRLIVFYFTCLSCVFVDRLSIYSFVHWCVHLLLALLTFTYFLIYIYIVIEVSIYLQCQCCFIDTDIDMVSNLSSLKTG